MAGSLDARGLRAETPDRVLFAGLGFSVGSETRLGLVGANGSGKSTLLAILAGERVPAGSASSPNTSAGP